MISLKGKRNLLKTESKYSKLLCGHIGFSHSTGSVLVSVLYIITRAR